MELWHGDRGASGAAAVPSRSVTALVTAGGILALAVVALLPAWTTDPLLALVNIAVTVGFGLTAVLLAGEPDQGPNVRAFLLVAACWTAGYVGVLAPDGPWALIQWTVGPLTFPLLAAVLLRYPRSEAPSRGARALVAGLAASLLALRVMSVLVSEPSWHGFDPRAWWPALRPAPALSAVCDGALIVVGAAAAVVFGALTVRRLVRAEGMDRRLLRPIGVVAVASAVVVGGEVTSSVLSPTQAATQVVVGVEALALLAIPLAFGVSALHRRLAHAAMAGLVVALARPVTPEIVERALADSLSDPALRVIYRRPDGEGHADPEDVDPEGDAPDPRRWTRTVTASDGTPLATIDLHPSLAAHPYLVDAAVSAARLALENSWLQATTQASLEEARESRARIVGAGDEARRRLERDLHDGVQQRLLALKVALATARSRATGPEDRAVIDRVRGQLQETLDELRSLARGIHPALLTEGGLLPAVRSVVERLPLDVEVRIVDERLDPLLEATAYYVCCESLANAVKHSGAPSAVVDVRRRDTILDVTVRDHGQGGAEEKAGGGLAGLRDRVAAVGGSMTVTSGPAGTEIRVTMPCA